MAKTAQTPQAQLEALKPGASIFIMVEGKKTSAKFDLLNGSGRLRCRIKGAIKWAAVEDFAGVDEAAPVTAPAPVEEVSAAQVLADKLGLNGGAFGAFKKEVAAHKSGAPAAKKAKPAADDFTPHKKGDTVSLDDTQHDWEKGNNITQTESGGRMYDIWYCEKCELKGKRYGVSGNIVVTKAALKGQECRPVKVAVENIATPLQRGILHIKLVANGGKGGDWDKLVIGRVYPVVDAPAENLHLAADVWIMGETMPLRLLEKEWERATPAEQSECNATPHGIPEYIEGEGRALYSGDESSIFGRKPLQSATGGGFSVVDAPARPEVSGLSEFGILIVETVAAMEQEEKAEAISVASLAERLKESPKKVAAAFTALNKTGLVNQSGEKGARLIQLTVAGWEYINGPETAPANAAPEYPETEQSMAQTVFELTADAIAALYSIFDASRAITTIFDADIIRKVEEARPEWVTLSASKMADAYFEAILTIEGREELQKVAPKPAAAEAPEPAPKGKPGRKPGSTTEAKTNAVLKEGAAKPRLRGEIAPIGGNAKGGRPAVGNKSLRETVLALLRETLKDEAIKPTQKEASLATAASLGITTQQVNNAFFKLGAAGFLTLSERGKSTPEFGLTEKGKTGYSTNYGANIRPRVAALIQEGKTDKEIAKEVGCDPAYIHDVRTNRGKKVAEEQAA